jgi:hypothetical protein
VAIKARSRLAWVIAWRAIEMLKFTDKLSVRLMSSKLSGCNVSQVSHSQEGV